MKHGVTCAICDSTTSVSLTTFTEVGRLSTESSLINFAFSSSTEWHTIRFKLSDSDWCLSCHVLDSILICEPVTTFDSVVEVPLPVVSVHVTESSVNSALQKKLTMMDKMFDFTLSSNGSI